MKSRVPVGIMMLFVFGACLVNAQVPRTLFYQGVLSDSTGAAKPDGPYSFTFRLYETSSGGSAVGTQQQTLQVKRGLFYTVFDQLLNGLSIDHPFWFTVQVQNEAELSPRIPFTSVPYSISSIRSDTARYALTIASNAGWSLTGNGGTTAVTDFIGTTDNIPFTIRVNNQQAGLISSAGPTFFGYQAGNSNTDPSSVGIGYQALFSNTTGSYNTATGASALLANTTGRNNTASGVGALYYNNESYNSAYGVNALFATTASQYNVAVGYNAGGLYNNGYNNTFVGARADVNGVGYYNVIAIGKGAVVTGPSAAVFGNSSTVSYSGYANWTNISDARYKKNIRDNVPGLNFITKLRPVTYNLDATGLDAFLHRNDKEREQGSAAAKAIHTKALQEKEAITYTGFVAQEVESAAKELGYDFSGVDAPRNENGTYGLRYAEFTVPLVKAVQELSKENRDLSNENKALAARVAALETLVKTLAKQR